MTRADLLAALAQHAVLVSIDGSPGEDLTARLARHLADDPRPLRVMDMTVVPGALRAVLGPDGSIPDD